MSNLPTREFVFTNKGTTFVTIVAKLARILTYLHCYISYLVGWRSKRSDYCLWFCILIKSVDGALIILVFLDIDDGAGGAWASI